MMQDIMHVEILADTPNNKKGDRIHLAADVSRTLIALGFAREVPPAPLPPAVVSWGVKSDTFGNPMLVGSCSRSNCGFHRYIGKPEYAAKYPFQHSAGCGTPTSVPAETIEQYKRAYDGASPSGTMDDAKLLDARKVGGRIDAAYDKQFEKLYGRPRRW